MKRIFTMIFFLTIGKVCFATEWAVYYIYVQTEYTQGPWIRTKILDKSGGYKYLYPKRHEELFGSEAIELANAIYSHLKKETEHPELYKFQCSLSLLADTVVIQTEEVLPDLNAIKNELTASFTLNSFAAVKIIQHNKKIVYQLKDISIPYMDLVFHPEN